MIIDFPGDVSELTRLDCLSRGAFL